MALDLGIIEAWALSPERPRDQQLPPKERALLDALDALHDPTRTPEAVQAAVDGAVAALGEGNNKLSTSLELRGLLTGFDRAPEPEKPGWLRRLADWLTKKGLVPNRPSQPVHAGAVAPEEGGALPTDLGHLDLSPEGVVSAHLTPRMLGLSPAGCLRDIRQTFNVEHAAGPLLKASSLTDHVNPTLSSRVRLGLMRDWWRVDDAQFAQLVLGACQSATDSSDAAVAQLEETLTASECNLDALPLSRLAALAAVLPCAMSSRLFVTALIRAEKQRITGELCKPGHCEPADEAAAWQALWEQRLSGLGPKFAAAQRAGLGELLGLMLRCPPGSTVYESLQSPSGIQSTVGLLSKFVEVSKAKDSRSWTCGLHTLSSAQGTELIEKVARKVYAVCPPETLDHLLESRQAEWLAAEARTLAGQPVPDQLLELDHVKQKLSGLIQKTDVAIAPWQPDQIKVGAPIRLDVLLKNVGAVTVRVFEVDTTRCLLNAGRPVGLDIDLDGLEPNHVQRHSFEQVPPGQELVHTFEGFEALPACGVFVIEVVGKDKAARALIQRGSLRLLSVANETGHKCTVLDHEGAVVPDAVVWLGTTPYSTQDGVVQIPLAERPSHNSVVVSSKQLGLAVMAEFQRAGEEYSLDAGLFVAREALVTAKSAHVVVRPKLRLNGVAASCSLLENASLAISTTDRLGQTAYKTVEGLELSDDCETVVPFVVPNQLIRLTLVLKAKVTKSTGSCTTVDLSSTASYCVSSDAGSTNVAGLHLHRDANGYKLAVLGRTGEPLPGQKLQISLKHVMLNRTISTLVASDNIGSVHLGMLTGIVTVAADLIEVASHCSYSWDLDTEHSWQWPGGHKAGADIVAQVSDPVIKVPFPRPFPADGITRAEFGLVQIFDESSEGKRGSEATNTDFFDSLGSNAEGELQISGLQVGVYSLSLPGLDRSVSVNVLAAEPVNGLVIGQHSIELQPDKPVSVLKSVQCQNEALAVQLDGVDSSCRVHVLCSVALCESSQDLITSFAAANASGTVSGSDAAYPQCKYHSGRMLGEEEVYVQRRREEAAQMPAGNMLKPPRLLINRLESRTTHTGIQREAAHAQEEWGTASLLETLSGAAAAPLRSLSKHKQMRRRSAANHTSAGEALGPPGTTSLAPIDFYDKPAVLLTNLKPEANVVRIPLSDLQASGGCFVQVVVVTGVSSEYASLALPPAVSAAPHLDLALGSSLGTGSEAEFFAQCERVSAVQPGKTLAMMEGGRTEICDTIEAAHRVMTSINHTPAQDLLAALKEWHNLDEAGKHANYEKFASHELHIFLARRDPQFFELIVAPHLQNKLEPQVIDDCLLGRPMAAWLEPSKWGGLDVQQSLLVLEAALKQGGDRALLHARLERIAKAGESCKLDGQLMSQVFNAALGSSSLGNSEALPQLGSHKSRPKPSRTRGSRYTSVGETEAYCESQYWRSRTGPEIGPSRFWADWARYLMGSFPLEGDATSESFVSEHFIEAARGYSEIAAVLTLMQLPSSLEAPAEWTRAGGEMSIGPETPCIVFHKQLLSVPAELDASIMTGMTFFDPERRQEHHEDAAQKYHTGDFLRHRAYGCQLVVTNISRVRQTLTALVQIPAGAIALGDKGSVLQTEFLTLNAYESASIENCFYFPRAGEYTCFGPQVSKNGKVVSRVLPPEPLKVVESLPPVPASERSFQQIVQHGSTQELLEFIEQQPVGRWQSNIRLVASKLWNDQPTFSRLIGLLRGRHIFVPEIWAQAPMHADFEATKELLQALAENLCKFGYSRREVEYKYGSLNECAPISTDLLTFDPQEFGMYSHCEYYPLFQARAHQLGEQRAIMNEGLRDQWTKFIWRCAGQQLPLSGTDALAAAYYLFLQCREAEAEQMLQLASTTPGDGMQMQSAYLTAYLHFSRGDLDSAVEIAHEQLKAQLPTEWKQMFTEIVSQATQALGKEPEAVSTADDRDGQIEKLVASEPVVQLAATDGDVTIYTENLELVQVSWYRIELELLFSSNPFLDSQADQVCGWLTVWRVTPWQNVSFLKAAHMQKLPAIHEQDIGITIPPELKNQNVMIEVSGGGKRETVPYFDNMLLCDVAHTVGQLKVTSKDGTPLPCVYVKAYARTHSGSTQFYKDGYTDRRGRFDYVSLSTSQLNNVARFALLVASPTHGSLVKQADPPKLGE